MPGHLPVVDLTLARGQCRGDYLDQLRRAGHETGFCYVVGHGIDLATMDRVVAMAGRFFALPEADRRAIGIERSPHFRGYSGVELGSAGPGSGRRDRLDVGTERAARVLGAGDPDSWVLEGPNQWPNTLPQLRPVVLDWMDRLTGLAQGLLRDLLVAIGTAADALDHVVDRPHVHLKLLRYLGGEQRLEGVGAHRDDCLITLLLQDGAGGLEIVRPDGRAEGVTPVPGALVMNLGTVLATATDGYLQAATHRVTSPPAGRQRISVPLFFGPRLDAVMPRLGAQTPPDAVAYGDMVLAGVVGALPEVVRRHHPRLLAIARS